MSQAVTILDGGMGKELLRIGAPFQQPEWSALALMEDPAAVRQAHQNFVDAGADVITTNTYAVVPFHLGDERFAERGLELASLAAGIAREVADAADRPIRVAGSLPPLFGSYEPEKFEPDRAPEIYDVLVKAQVDKVDFWVGETISSLAEFDAVANAIAGRGEELWASFTVEDDPPHDRARLRSGESIEAAVAHVAGKVSAMLFNCSQPERMAAALADAAAAVGAAGSVGSMQLGVYANAFVDKEEGYAANDVVLEHRADLTPTAYAEMVAGWIDLGASIVGGCCGIRPDHIEALGQLRAAV